LMRWLARCCNGARHNGRHSLLAMEVTRWTDVVCGTLRFSLSLCTVLAAHPLLSLLPCPCFARCR
jgi:hypothetical protein